VFNSLHGVSAMTDNNVRILRRPEVAAITGLGKSSIHELEREGSFPQRVRLSTRATGWRSDEVQAWIESRPRATDAGSDCDDRLRASHRDRARGGEGAA